MNSQHFEAVVEEQIRICKDVLIGKAKEYAQDDDRLHNFKNAAGMMGCDPKEALAGMMAKHTISIYDMCRDGEEHSIGLWTEKITDHINYLLLLKAIVMEEKKKGGKLHYFDASEVKTVDPGNKGFSGLVKGWDTLLKDYADQSEKYWVKRVAESLGVCADINGKCDDCVMPKCQSCPNSAFTCTGTLMLHAKAIIEKHILNSEEKND